jgi:multidrug transporter EmrE-like cation transporter
VRLGLQPWSLVCFACYAVSIVLWAGALNLVEVNYAYPFLALGFLANALMCRAFLSEGIPPMRWLALALIILGVALQAFTGAPKNL